MNSYNSIIRLIIITYTNKFLLINSKYLKIWIWLISNWDNNKKPNIPDNILENNKEKITFSITEITPPNNHNLCLACLITCNNSNKNLSNRILIIIPIQINNKLLKIMIYIIPAPDSLPKWAMEWTIISNMHNNKPPQNKNTKMGVEEKINRLKMKMNSLSISIKLLKTKELL